MAICKNFKYTARPDGGYNCETEMIAIGEVIESIKSTRKGVKDKDGEFKEVDEIEIFLEKILTYNDLADYVKNDSGWGSKAFWMDPLGITGFRKRKAKEKAALEQGIIEDLPQVDDDSEPTLYPWVLDGNTKLKNENGEALDNDFKGCYIRWDALAHLFNVRFTPKNEKDGSPMFVIQTNTIVNEDKPVEKQNGKRIKPLLYNKYQDPIQKKYPSMKKIDLDISLDPSVGLLPHQLDELKAKNHNLGRLILGVCAWGFAPTAGIGASIIAQEIRKMTEDPIPKDIEDRMIGKVYFNVQRLLDTYKSMRYDSEGMTIKDFNLYDYIKKIWDQLDDACAGTHNFELVTDHERPNIIKVIDLSFGAGSEESLDLEKIVELNIQSNDSIVRDFSYHTSIPSAMTATIAVAAQSPNDIDSIEQTSFAALHKAIKNRFTVPDEPPQKLTKEQKEEKAEKEKEEKEAAIEKYEEMVEVYKEGMLFLKEYSIEILEGDYQKIKDSGEAKSQKIINTAKSVLRKTIEAAEYIVKHHDGRQGHKGKPRKLKRNPNSSAIIPLKFQATLDGMGGIIIGNVFQIKKSRLPRGYKEASVAFVVTGESQSISPGGDWTTTITGQMILLPPTKGKGNKKGEEGDGGEGGGTGDYENNTNKVAETPTEPTTDTSSEGNTEQQNKLEQQSKCPDGQHWDEELKTCVMDDVDVEEDKDKDFTGYDEWKQTTLKYSENFGFLNYYQNEFVVNSNEGRYQEVKKGNIGTIEIVNTGDLLFSNSMGYIKNQKVLAINASKQYKGAHFMDRLKEEFGEKGAIGSGTSNVILRFDDVKKYHDEAISKKQNASHIKKYYDGIMKEAKINPFIIKGVHAERKKAPAGGWPKDKVPPGQDPNADIIKRDEIEYNIPIDPSLIKDFEPYTDI